MLGAAFDYSPRAPESSVLYGVIAGELETFLAAQQARETSLPKFVEAEFRSYLQCGILAHGFIRVRCESCGHARLVGFSCKRRGWCPSCGGRRMAETAAHLVDHVFPDVPVRQWVLSIPFPLRYRLAYDAGLMSRVLNVFIRTVFSDLRRRAKGQLGLKTVQCGAATFIQRFNDALNVAPHFHSIVIDGVYAANAAGKPKFHELPPPEDSDVVRVVTQIGEKVETLFKGLGLHPEDKSEDDPSRDEPALAAIYSASVRSRIAAGPNAGNRVVTLGDRVDGDTLESVRTARCAGVRGFNLHANCAIGPHDRLRLERLVRYAARPAIATERLSELPDGRLLYRLKRRWTNGTTEVVFDRQDFIAKLAALVPAPRAHLRTYHGVLGPAAKWRPLLIPEPEVLLSPCPQVPNSLELSNDASTVEPQTQAVKKNYSWAQLLQRVFDIEISACELCGGPVRIIAAIETPKTVEKILNHLGLPSRPPPTERPRYQTISTSDNLIS
jgi:ribosomal protein S27E